MKTLVPHVDAIFGGKPVRFELYRDPSTVNDLEAAIGSANGAWGRFMLGTWTVGDIRTILALAHPKPADHGRGLYHPLRPDLAAYPFGLNAALRGVTIPKPVQPQRVPRGVPPDWIDRVLASRPLATYAGLAGLVLQAAMIGLPEPLARFDERSALDSVREQYDETSGDGAAAA